MGPIILLIDRLAPFIYLVSMLGILAAMLVFFLGQREVTRAKRYVGREEASARAYRAGFLAMGLLLLMAAVALIDTRIAPLFVSSSNQESGTNSPLSPVMVLGSTLTPTPPLERTIIEISTLTPPPAPQTTTTPQPAVVAACPNPGVRITSPGTGANLQGVVEARGTATINDFWYYKLEYGSGENPGDEDFVWIGAEYSPVVDGMLLAWDTSTLPRGVYTLRLVVVDNTGNFPEPCRVVVNIT